MMALDTAVYRRRKTRVVMVGFVGVGGNHPIRVQSMTTPRTSDVVATVAQIRRLVEAGCEIARVTVPSTKDAEALPLIRQALAREKIRIPLVADIHFSPAAAMQAVEHVEKVRVNPGNYADTKRFKVWEYTESEYAAELERIEERFKPLVLRARDLGVSMRIGTNHGSLSDRILNRYGDTPLGMVESALEFVRICERHSYRDLILSMKSSNPMVMIQAYRLLADKMAEEGMDYPFHLGVTEAGEGEDGRIKSAIGIGSLLEDGIGDTIRVSLTEDPVEEIPVALRLVDKYNRSAAERRRLPSMAPPAPSVDTYIRRSSRRLELGALSLGGQEPVRVESLLVSSLRDRRAVDEEIDALTGSATLPEARAELLEVDLGTPGLDPEFVNLSRRLGTSGSAPLLSVRLDLDALLRWPDPPLKEVSESSSRITLRVPAVSPGSTAVQQALVRLLPVCPPGRVGLCLQLAADAPPDDDIDFLVQAAMEWSERSGQVPLFALDVPAHRSPVHAYRQLASVLSRIGLAAPILLVTSPHERAEDPLLFSSAYLGSLLCEGIGDAIRVENFSSPPDALRLAFNILQGARLRLFKAEFISCPSCGRTQFDLEETTRRIRARTGHLKGVKIAVMGCIVNGPGEMADADFGYVGWGPGKVSLFVGKEMVEKDIPFDQADDKLIQLIRSHGRWTDPVPGTSPITGSPQASED